jgi:hypothetical protein
MSLPLAFTPAGGFSAPASRVILTAVVQCLTKDEQCPPMVRLKVNAHWRKPKRYQGLWATRSRSAGGPFFAPPSRWRQFANKRRRPVMRDLLRSKPYLIMIVRRKVTA